ncbi:MAG: YbbR-like domain-containing protein [Prevotella sp.]|nr:YbbR-like domain-containing protein [Prevotella sp.]
MKSILRTIVNFVFSKANKEFVIFLLFFALASVFWLMTTLNESYEQEIKILVRYVNVPKNAVMTSGETDTLRLTLRDKGYAMLSYIYEARSKSIDIDFMQYSKALGSGSVSNADLVKIIESRLPASTHLVSVKPDHLSFYYNFGEKKQVPVEWRGQVEPEALYFLSGYRCRPDSVTVYASKARLDSISVVYTEDLNYTDFHDTLHVSTPLLRMAGVKLVPDRVDIDFYTDILTEERIDGIPVTGVNMPEGKMLRTFPAKVSVTFVAGMNTYRSLTASDFLVTADYNEFPTDSSTKCAVRLQKTPPGISRVHIVPAEVDYLIEEKSR